MNLEKHASYCIFVRDVSSDRRTWNGKITNAPYLFYVRRSNKDGRWNGRFIPLFPGRRSYFNPGEVKGVLDALNKLIVIWMGEGYNINLEGIGISSCALHNHCSKQKALQDLKELVEEGQLLQVGNGRTVMYIRAYK